MDFFEVMVQITKIILGIFGLMFMWLIIDKLNTIVLLAMKLMEKVP